MISRGNTVARRDAAPDRCLMNTSTTVESRPASFDGGAVSRQEAHCIHGVHHGQCHRSHQRNGPDFLIAINAMRKERNKWEEQWYIDQADVNDTK